MIAAAARNDMEFLLAATATQPSKGGSRRTPKRSAL